MKIIDVFKRILTDEKLEEANTITIANVIKKKPDKHISQLVLAINESDVRKEDIIVNNRKKGTITKLTDSKHIIPLANTLAKNGLFDESLKLFDAMHKKGCTESSMLNDYGAVLLNKMLLSRKINKKDLDFASKIIFFFFNVIL